MSQRAALAAQHSDRLANLASACGQRPRVWSAVPMAFAAVLHEPESRQARGSGELFGVFYRRSYGLIVPAIDTLCY